MPFEDAKYISELVDTNPVSDDPVNQGDDQIRQIKLALQANVLGDVIGTQLLVNNLVCLDLTRAPGPLITLLSEAQAKLASLGILSGDDLTLLNETAAGLIILAGANSVFEGDPLGRSRMFNAGIERIAAEALGASVTGDLDVTGDATAQNLGAVLQAIALAPAPTLDEHLTRKDYVDGEIAPVQSQADANTAQIGVNTGNIATNTGGIAANTGELATIDGNQVTNQDRLKIGTSLALAGLQTAVGQAITVTFAVAFDQVPAVTLTLLNPGNANNGFAYLNSVTTTGFTGTAGVAGLQCNWQAIGRTAT